MDKNNLLNNVESLTLYTGTFGRKRCTCSCIGCTQESYGRKHEDYQGNLEQIQTIIKKLPNLKEAYLLGNPDVSVDANFCNKAAKEFIKSGKKVMFSTSGYGGIETIKELVKDIEPKNILYISYSIDTLNNQKLQYLKGNRQIEIEKIDEAIKYCIENKIIVKIQPTIWQTNQDDYEEIINHYRNMGIKWFTFHAGSFEALEEEKVPLKHVSPEKWLTIIENLKKLAIKYKLKIKAPKIFLKEKEWDKYKSESQTYCNEGGEGLQIWMQKDGLKATFCPLLSQIKPEFTFDIEKEEPKLIGKQIENKCIACTKCIDKPIREKSIDKRGIEFLINNQVIHNVCRYYKEKIRIKENIYWEVNVLQ